MYRFLVLLAALIGLFVAQCAAADKDDNTDKKKEAAKKAFAKLVNGSAEDFIKRFDKNGDGVLTKDELPPRLADAFDKVDKNNDGKLDKEEVEAMLQVLRKRMAENNGKPDDKKKTDKKKTDDKPKVNDAQVDALVNQILERMDKNKDGKISKDEAMGPIAENFDRLDTNKDGFLDKSELRTLAMRRLAQQGGGNPAGPRVNIPDFDGYDKDADGRLTREEVKGTPIESLFDQMDENKDGKVTRKEFESYYRKQAAKQEKKE